MNRKLRAYTLTALLPLTIFVLSLTSFSSQSYAAFVPSNENVKSEKQIKPGIPQDTYSILAILNNKEIERLTGKKLTLREKAGLYFLRRQAGKSGTGTARNSADREDKCFSMYLKNGDVIEVKLIQITTTEIKYKRCNKPDDPEIIIAKDDVFSIKDGTGDTIYSSKNESWKKRYEVADGTTDRLALAAGITGIVSVTVGLFFWPLGLPAGIAAGIMGIAAMRRFKANKNLRGEGWAITGIIAGGLWIFFAILVLIALAAGW
jgi:hypothetical protein